MIKRLRHPPGTHAGSGDPAAVPAFLQRARRLAAIGSARMPDWQRLAIYVATAALLLSGGLWLLLGVLCFPLVWTISYFFIRRSIWLEEDEVAQVKKGRLDS